METNKETETKPERKYNEQNLRKIDSQEAKRIGSLGGIKSGESKRRKKSMKESLLLLLEAQYSTNKAQEILGSDIDKLGGDLSIQNIINFKMLQEAMEGNAKAYELIRDTSGNKPVTEVNLEADIITEKDKQLLEALTKPEKN